MAEENQAQPIVAEAAVEGKKSKELIDSVNPVTPTKGSNAGKQMYIINGKHWSRTEPKPTDTYVNLETVEVKDKGTFVNVIGFSNERLTMDAKIKTLTSHDAAYSVAIASLLK